MAVTQVHKNTEKKERVHCPKCASILEYAEADTKIRPASRSFFFRTEGREWVDCPVCGHEVVLRTWGKLL